MSDPFKVICADPPWSHADQLPGKGRGGSKHYKSMMTVEQICAYPIPEMAEDSVLLLWRVASMQPEALKVVKAWGFTLKTEMVWDKRRRCIECKGSGKTLVSIGDGRHSAHVCDHCEGVGDFPWMGMGWQTRGAHETCLIATRGKNIRTDATVLSIFRARMPLVEGTNKTRHSAKPDEFFERVERLYPGPYKELFSRNPRPGWDCEGDEAWLPPREGQVDHDH
jgi:N6-adenosine-specific RNA methylase IME4